MQGGNMRYQEVTENENDIRDNLLKYFTARKDEITIDSEGLVSCAGTVSLAALLDKLPIKFKSVSIDFDCSRNSLTSLIGSPQTVGRDFKCYENELTSLVGSPTNIGADFRCNNNNILSLYGCPTMVREMFDCRGNKLSSLHGAENLTCNTFNCVFNPLISLVGFPKEVGDRFYCDWSPNLPLLRTLTVKNRVHIYNRGPTVTTEHEISKIINQFIPHSNLRHAILDCQRALIEAGYAGNARW
jgi:hypothetical protein